MLVGAYAVTSLGEVQSEDVVGVAMFCVGVPMYWTGKTVREDGT